MKGGKEVLFVVAAMLAVFLMGCNMSITEVPVTGVTLDKESISLFIGEEQTLVATIAPSNATNQEVKWESKDPTVATVDAYGNVTGAGEGHTAITVTTTDGSKTAECGVVVCPPYPVESVELNEPSLTMTVDTSYTLVATVYPSYAANKKVHWSSSNTSVVRVEASQDGTIFAINEGSAIITVTTEDGGKTATCNVTVGP
jgi:uncharacterized protein YjdB